MITVAFPTAVTAAAAENSEGRAISGIAVPWDVVGTVTDGTKVRFLPGSLDAAARPVVLRDHDRARPIGRVTAARDTGTELEATARVSRTRDGDEALVLAADGVCAMFSVGANPTEWDYAEDGVLEVRAAEWQELSLLTLGAFSSARVVDVAASAPAPQVPEEPEEEEPEEPDEEPDEEERETMTETITAGHVPAVLPLGAGAPPAAPLTLSNLSRLIAAGTPATEIMAALADIKTADIAGVVRPAVSDEVRGLIEYGRPVINAINQAPLPASGMSVDWPRWTDLPDVGIQANQKTEVTTGTATIGTTTTPVLTFAGANDISLQAVQRSNPSFVEAYLRGAAEVFARVTEGHVITQLTAAAGVVAPAATFLDTVEAIVGSFAPATTPSGRIWIAISWDVFATLIGVTSQNGPAYWSPSVNFGSGAPGEGTAGGFNIFPSRQLPVKTILAGVENAATWYEDPANPQEIRVFDVALLGLNIGVYGFAALAIEVPEAIKKVTFTTLPTAAATTSTAKK